MRYEIRVSVGRVKISSNTLGNFNSPNEDVTSPKERS